MTLNTILNKMIIQYLLLKNATTVQDFNLRYILHGRDSCTPFI